jgi:uridine kinase
VHFIPLTPAKLVEALADWVLARAELADGAGFVVGFDGLAEIGTTKLADEVAEALRGTGRHIIRTSTSWWWRPPALRLELGRQDIGMLLTGWVDGAALRRELIDPVVATGTNYITRLRDPDSGRSIRQQPETGSAGAILLLDGPFLLATDLPLGAVVGLAVSPGRLRRALPADRAWWAGAVEHYQQQYAPVERADVVLSYDHESAPAASGLDVSRLR